MATFWNYNILNCIFFLFVCLKEKCKSFKQRIKGFSYFNIMMYLLSQFHWQEKELKFYDQINRRKDNGSKLKCSKCMG